MTEHTQPAAAPDLKPGYERSDINPRLIGALFAIIVVGIVVAVLAVQHYFAVVYEEQLYVKVLSPVASDLKQLRAREDAQLHSYGYIDREKGLVRLPIERAMELLAAEYAAGNVKYPTQPYPVKPIEPAGQAPEQEAADAAQ